MKHANTIDESAVILHEIYLAYLRAGFSPDQALAIVMHQLDRSIDQAQEVGHAREG